MPFWPDLVFSGSKLRAGRPAPGYEWLRVLNRHYDKKSRRELTLVASGRPKPLVPSRVGQTTKKDLALLCLHSGILDIMENQICFCFLKKKNYPSLGQVCVGSGIQKSAVESNCPPIPQGRIEVR